MLKAKKRSETKRITLFDQEWSLYEIKKHSSIVQMTNATTWVQRKTFNALLWVANEMIKQDPTTTKFSTTYSYLKNIVWNKLNNAYLKQALQEMQETRIEFNILWKDNVSSWWQFNLLSYVALDFDNNSQHWIIKFEFPSIVVEHLSNPRLYAKLNLILMKDLDSKHSIALYELLKDYQNIGTIWITIDQFRELMAIKPTQYKSLFMMKVKVIDVAVNEINEKTDIRVSYCIKKDHSQQEWWSKKIVFKIEKVAEDFWNLPALDIDLVEELVKHGITKKRAEQFVSVYPKEYIVSHISLVQQKFEKWEIKNIWAYLSSALENDYVTPVTEYKNITNKKKEESQKKQEVLDQKVEQEKKDKTEFYQRRDAKVEKRLSNKSPVEKKILQERFEKQIINTPIDIVYKKSGLEWPIIKGSRYSFIGREFLPEIENNYARFVSWETTLF